MPLRDMHRSAWDGAAALQLFRAAIEPVPNVPARAAHGQRGRGRQLRHSHPLERRPQHRYLFLGSVAPNLPVRGMPQGSKLIELIFETHASSVDNEARLASGHFDAPLSARGELLRECDYGRLTRHPSGEVEAVRVRFITEPFPGGESYADVV